MRKSVVDRRASRALLGTGEPHSSLQAALVAELGVSKSDAEDIASQAILVVLTKWGPEHLGNPALLRAVAWREARSLARKRRREVLVGVEPEEQSGLPAPTADGETANALLLDLCQTARIRAAEDIALLRMVLHDGSSYGEAADALGAAESALRKRVNRLRRRLQGALRRWRGGCTAQIGVTNRLREDVY
jgi:DNA-directed RNA polymerase specialized sigma24 family protein